MRILPTIICFLIILCSCKEKDTNKIDSSSTEKQDSGLQSKDGKLIYEDEKVKIYANHSIIEEGEERLIIYSDRQDTLLIFEHDDGGKITFPFALNDEEETFINFFEVWEGSGFLSKKNFYHLNTNDYSLDPVVETEFKTMLNDVKKRFKIKDSIYTRTGELYENYAFDKSCFNKNGELPFKLVLFNHDQPSLNKGLEGFKTLNGIYKFEKDDNYVLKPVFIDLID
ncbi:hypothetical protein [Aquimarina sp. SS2-1]|uniref:hypothetical protein n=1 Tax=Aquimarina besae TaxID=3342247 RepID=UPI0036723F43